MKLSANDRMRYRRQMMIDDWGVAGQEKLKSSTVFVAGAGGLGSPVCVALAIAGVGRLLVADFDSPELTNLNRQFLHDDSSIGINKALSAKQTLERINPQIEVVAISRKITAANVEQLVDKADVIVDCLDNFATRFLINSCAIGRGIPLVHGSIWGLEGQMTFLHSPATACLRCLYQEAPPKELFPVLGASPGIIGNIMAMETIKYLVGIGTNLSGRLLVFDMANMDFSTLQIMRNPGCPACGDGKNL